MQYDIVMVNNHTGVWGSWYDPTSGAWGYACCHSVIHVSYCSGQAGIDAAQASSAQNLLASTSAIPAIRPPSPPPKASITDRADRDRDRRDEQVEGKERVEQNFSKKRVGEGDIRIDKDRLAQAMQEEKKRKMRGEDDDERSGKKRKNGPESGSHDVTEEELGTWFVGRLRGHVSEFFFLLQRRTG